jgi:uracil phosphoribosyltransferase
MSQVTVVSHPLVQHKLTKMRDKTTSTKTFRALMRETATLICYEVTRDLPMDEVQIETPVAPTTAKEIAGKKLVFAPILRAGLGMADGMLDLVPSARVAHVGLYRDPESLEAVAYYFKAPQDIAGRLVIVVDPMLATGHSAIAAVSRLKAAGVTDLRFVCLLAAQVGVDNLRAAHPDVPIWTAAIDAQLNDHGYIVPGLGDAGDRTFGTR